MVDKTPLTVETVVNAPADVAWKAWTDPDHVTKWNAASEDWHCPSGKADLREGGEFSFRMEAKDGSVGFDFGGRYTKVVPGKELAYVMSDGRAVTVTFQEQGSATLVVETFDPESENSPEMQRQGWQSILDNFKRYAESPAVA